HTTLPPPSGTEIEEAERRPRRGDRSILRRSLVMLVLSRQRDESIIIGDNVVITVVDVRGDKVRLGIEAPIEIPVHRREVYEAIQRENRLAAEMKPEETRQLPKKS